MSALLLLLLMQAKPCPGPAPCDLRATVSIVHRATLYYQSTACNNATPCSISVYRNVCPTPTTCPSYGSGKGWTRLINGTITASRNATGTQWEVIDKDTALKDSTTYVYVATLTWINQPQKTSQPGPPWSGTTSGPVGGNPPAPTVGANNSVN